MRRPPEALETLAELRAQIDEIDTDLLALLAERQAHVDRVVGIKAAEGVSAAAPSRAADVLARVRARASEAGFDADLAETMWREMIAFFVAREEQHLGKGGTDA